MRIRTSAALACLAIVALAAAKPANAEIVSWKIVSSASSIQLSVPQQTVTITSSASIGGLLGTSLSISARALNPATSAGSTQPTSSLSNGGTVTGLSTAWYAGNTQNLGGFFNTEIDTPNFGGLTSQIAFLSALSNIEGLDSGSYNPLSDGSAGAASADFGARIFVGRTGFLTDATMNIDAAFRNMFYAMASGDLALTPAGPDFTFNGTGVNVGSEDGAQFAFRARNGGGTLGGTLVGLLGSGSAELPELSQANTLAGGTIEYLGGSSYRLTLPINIPIAIPLDDDGLISFKAGIQGTIVAVIPEPTSMALLGLGLAMVAPWAVRRLRKKSA